MSCYSNAGFSYFIKKMVTEFSLYFVVDNCFMECDDSE